MLRELRVSNFAVIADARLEPGPGFTALSGETGAGKSVCIAALRAALGGRVESEVLRPGADVGRATAVFDGLSPALRGRLAELGVPDDEFTTLSREIVRSGRGSCRLNGALVSQAVLREVGDGLAEVTHQGSSQRLLRTAWQRDLLDAAGGEALAVALQETDSSVRAWREAIATLDAARRAAHSDAAAVERARELVDDLAPLQLRLGEEEALSEEAVRLRHATRLVAAAGAIAAAAAGDEVGAADELAAAVRACAELTGIDPTLATLTEEGALLVERLRELARDARRHADSVAVDEARLAEVEARLDVLARATRRHGSLEEALADLSRARELLDAYDGGDDAMARHEAAVASLLGRTIAAATALSKLRVAAARRLERAATEQLRELELPYARFRIVVGRTPHLDGVDLGDGYPVRCASHGIDDVDFRLVTNRDMVPVPLDQGPSGGELSRLALALSAVVTEAGAPALVLDEVDAGLGGETAARVGDVLAAIGGCRQVLVVTHRPEIAARAGSHLLVSKRDAAGAPVASVDAVEGGQRVVEVARLMSGRPTRAALKRAEELLAEGAAELAGTPARRSATRTM